MGCISQPISYDLNNQINSDKPQIDQNSLSRQLAVYGHETQGKLMEMKVYIHGMTGVDIS